MAKYTRSYENGIEKHELTFREKTFDFSMLPSANGRSGDKPCFSYQLSEEFTDLTEDDLEDIGLGMLWFESDDEIYDIMELLEGFEWTDE